MSAAEPSPATLAPGEPTAAPRVRRRFFQFSLRTLLVATLLLSILLAAFAWRLQRARKQAAAVATIRGLGGEVQYDHAFKQLPGGGYTWPDKPGSRVPSIFLKWLGEDFFHDVQAAYSNRTKPGSPEDARLFWQTVAQLPNVHTIQAYDVWLDHEGFALLRGNPVLQEVSLMLAPISDEDLAVAGTMSNLRTLNLIGFKLNVTDQGIQHLDDLSELQSFKLNLSQITDESAKHLARHQKLLALDLTGNRLTNKSASWLGNLTELRQLGLGMTDIGDEGLRNLKPLTKLTSLDIGSTKVTDQGLVHLTNMVDLASIDVQQTAVHGPGLTYLRKLPKLTGIFMLANPVTDENLEYFEALPNLESINLGGSKVTDDGIARLQISPNTTSINLPSTEIGDRSLDALAKYPQLTQVWVSNTRVTAAGIARFKKAVPACYVAQ